MNPLKRGDHGDDVIEVQSQLISKGYKITADGDFGPGTEAAVKDFQTKNKLTVDGIVNAAFMTALQSDPKENNIKEIINASRAIATPIITAVKGATNF